MAFLKLGPGQSNTPQRYRQPQATDSYPTSPYLTHTDNRHRWRWWEFLILPLALVRYILAIFFPWLRTYGLAKFWLSWTIFWVVLGMFAVKLDANAGEGHFASLYWIEASGNNCRPGDATHAASWPFGKLYLLEIGCTTLATATMLDSVGLHSQADWVVTQQYDSADGYFMRRSFSVSYIWLCIISLPAFTLIWFWLLGAGAVKLAQHFRISWE